MTKLVKILFNSSFLTVKNYFDNLFNDLMLDYSNENQPTWQGKLSKNLNLSNQIITIEDFISLAQYNHPQNKLSLPITFNISPNTTSIFDFILTAPKNLSLLDSLFPNMYAPIHHNAVNKAVEEMRGAYAICAIAADEPDKMVAVRKDAPLVAGIGKGFNFIASDIPALLKYVRQVYLIENNETVVLTKDDIVIYNEFGETVKREVFNVTWDADAAEKEGYDHFMLKEIFEQPKGISETLNRRLDGNGQIKLDGISLTKEDLDVIDKVRVKYQALHKIPCTGCRYCVPYCPQKLDIPTLLQHYNNLSYGGSSFVSKGAIAALPDESKPSACIGCGSCEAVCPQQLAISKAMVACTELLNPKGA